MVLLRWLITHWTVNVLVCAQCRVELGNGHEKKCKFNIPSCLPFVGRIEWWLSYSHVLAVCVWNRVKILRRIVNFVFQCACSWWVELGKDCMKNCKLYSRMWLLWWVDLVRFWQWRQWQVSCSPPCAAARFNWVMTILCSLKTFSCVFVCLGWGGVVICCYLLVCTSVRELMANYNNN